jgi:hypothetical protein
LGGAPEKKGRKVFSRGVWAPAETIERIRAELDAERPSENYAKRKTADSKSERMPEPIIWEISSAQWKRPLSFFHRMAAEISSPL